MEYWTIAPLALGKGVRDRSLFTYLKDPGVKIEAGVLAWLVMSGKEKIIVDTGGLPLSKIPEFFKPFFQTAEQTLEAQLNRFNTSLDEIEIVINTHLHWDHCYGNSLFKKAHFFVQKKEIDYAKNPHPSHAIGYLVGQQGIDPPFERTNFDVLQGDVHLAQGIEVILTPGHTPGIQAVCIQTREGLYIIAGDTIPLFENMAVPDEARFLPSSIFIDLKDYSQSLDRIKKLGGFILPGHDLRVLEKTIYP